MSAIASSLTTSEYDFIDYGSGHGESLALYERHSAGRGLGVELEPTKVVEARANGHNVVEGSIFDIPRRPLVHFVTADNVLEHLTSFNDVEDALRVGCAIADDFIYVRHPSFEDERYFDELGVVASWVARTGHRSHVLIADFMAMAIRLGITSVEVHPVGLIPDANDPEIVPVGTPRNDLVYDADRHGAKPDIVFDRNVYYAFDLVFHLKPRAQVRLAYGGDPLTHRRKPRLVRLRSPRSRASAQIGAGKALARRTVRGVANRP